MTFHAPQIIMLVLLVIGDGYSLAKDGEPREGKHSFVYSFLGTITMCLLLWWGGFFK